MVEKMHTRSSDLTITDLPAELLHMIMLQVALDYLSFNGHVIVDEVPHFLTFIRNHPRIGKAVTSLSLSHSTIQAKVVGDMISLLPNLSRLSLDDARTLPPTRGDAGDSNAASLRLLRMDVESSGSYIPGLMHMLSSFNPQHLHLTVHPPNSKVGSFDARSLTKLPAVESLNVHTRTGTRQNVSIARVVDVLSKTLAPDTLQLMRVTYDSKDTLRAYGSIIKRCGSKITSLTLYTDAPYPFKERVGWVDPFDEWEILNVHACKELQSLEIPIHVPQEKQDRAASYVGAGILAHHAPPSLRKVVIRLHDLPRPTTLGNRSTLKLQEFDKVVTQARFPHLQEFELAIGVTRDLFHKRGHWEKCVAAARRALPGLHARGVLKLTSQSWTY